MERCGAFNRGKKEKKERRRLFKHPSDPVYSWSTRGKLSEGRILIKNPCSPLSDPPSFLPNLNPGSSLLAVQQIAVKVLNCWLLFSCPLPCFLWSSCFSAPQFSPFTPFLCWTDPCIYKRKSITRTLVQPVDSSPSALPNPSRTAQIQQLDPSQQNKLLIWLHHLPPSMCTFPSPATSLNLQQGRDWQLNRKLLNTEGSEASNEPDTVIIAFFWKPKSLQTSIALGILYKGTVNTSVHSQSPDRLKCRHSPIQNK